MNDQLWGWILSVLGLVGFWVTGKKIWWGWWLNVAAQAVWYAYAIATQQWGFLVMTTMYTVIFTKNALEWTKEHRANQERERVEGEGEDSTRACPWDCPDECDHNPGDIFKHEFVVDALGYDSNEAMLARIEAQIRGWLDELPPDITRDRIDVHMDRSVLASNLYTIKAVVRR